MPYHARVIFHHCTLNTYLLCKYYHSKPTAVEQGFHQCFCFHHCCPDSVWRKIHKQQSKQGEWRDLVLQYSDNQFTFRHSSLPLLWVTELVAEECVGWGWLKESGHFLLLNLWLNLWAVFVASSHHKQNGKCSCLLQARWDLAEVFGEQVGRDFSLVGAFWNVNRE